MADKRTIKISAEEWGEFDRRCEEFLVSALNDRHPEFENESLDKWEMQHSVSMVFESFDRPPHLPGSAKEPCPIHSEKPGKRDATIFRLLKKDILWLYDSCVVHRIYLAKRYRDRAFLLELSRCLEAAVPPKHQTRDGYSHIKNFLYRLDDSGIVLFDGTDEKSRDRAATKVYKIIKKIVAEPEKWEIAKLNVLASPKEFRKTCKPWLDNLYSARQGFLPYEG